MKNYSIVSYLSGDDFKKVRGIQKELSRLTGSQKCLIDWLPHVTVGTGIILDGNDLEMVGKRFDDLSRYTNKFRVPTKGFKGWDRWKGAVEGHISPYVICLELGANEDLQNLFSDIKKVTDNHDVWLPRIENCKPHITLAFADLDEVGYRDGLEYVNSLTSFSLDVSVNHFSLTECYGMGNMESAECKRYILKDLKEG